MAEIPIVFWSRVHWPSVGVVSCVLGYVESGDGVGVGVGWLLRWGLEREMER